MGYVDFFPMPTENVRFSVVDTKEGLGLPSGRIRALFSSVPGRWLASNRQNVKRPSRPPDRPVSAFL